MSHSAGEAPCRDKTLAEPRTTWEQKETGRLVRPSARYIGPDPRSPKDVEGWDNIVHS